MEEENINNTEDVEKSDEQPVEGEESPKGDYKSKTAKRFDELTEKLSEQTSFNERLIEQINQLDETVKRLSQSSTKEESDEIMAELEKLDEERPESYKDLFKKLRDANKKMDERESKQKEEENSQREARDLRELESQLTDLEEDGLIKPDEEAEFTKFCADKLKNGGSPAKWGNLYAALPAWRKETQKDSTPSDNTRRTIGPSGGTGATTVKISPDELKGMSMTEAMRRARESS